MSYKETFGCAAFGLDDQVMQVGRDRIYPYFYLADAVLPVHPSGIIRTGNTAEKERIHSGLSWPPEARIKRGIFMRRAPIPCVWNGLVDAGDRLVRWNVGRGVSFTLSKIISTHLIGLLKKSECNAQDIVVIAIPDALDEFGQEALLRELKISGFENVQLLWRPVAAALSWISELDQNNALDLDTSDKEHIIVVYLGPDGVEMTTFQLHRECHKYGKFVIPIRERPMHLSSVTGFDWCANTIEAFHSDIDDGAFWQAFTHYPHVWEAISGRPFSSDEDIWSLEDYWTLWSPDAKMVDTALDVSASQNVRLRTILSKSCPIFNESADNIKESVDEGLSKLFLSIVDQNQDSKLRGVVISGPLCPPKLPNWILSASNKLRLRGVKSASSIPKLDTVWLTYKENAIVDGCAEYGRRLDMGLPTYLDTLPKLSILVDHKGEHVWIDLLNEETCEGGKPFKPEPLKGRFAIQAGAQHLEVYLKRARMLRRGTNDPSKDITDTEIELTEQGQSEIAVKIRNAGSYENAIKLFENNKTEVGKYARKLASRLFGNPFRRAVFTFPSIPKDNMPVDLHLEIRPASGLAQITLVPSKKEDSEFLRGHQIFLDYSTMEDTDPPPPPNRGWPDVVSLEIDPDASALSTFGYKIDKYLQANPIEAFFIDALNGIKDVITSITNLPTDEGFEYLRFIDQDGIAGTKEATIIVDRIALKAEKDFNTVSVRNRNTFVIRMSWLFAKTPKNIVKEIRRWISQQYYDQKWNYGVDAAGRVFTELDDFRLLYSKIYKRILSNHKTPFPIQASRALWRSLSLRDESPRAMSRSQAKIFAEETVKILIREVRRNKFQQSFFQAARLFLYLLRFRVVEHGFLDPENQLDSDLFHRTLKCLKAAEKHFSRYNSMAGIRAKDLVIGIENFMRYEGSNEILKALDELAGN